VSGAHFIAFIPILPFFTNFTGARVNYRNLPVIYRFLPVTFPGFKSLRPIISLSVRKAGDGKHAGIQNAGLSCCFNCLLYVSLGMMDSKYTTMVEVNIFGFIDMFY